MKTLFIIQILICLTVPKLLLAQTSPLEAYISEGRAQNLVLKQKNISLQKALLALQTARSMYQPSIDFQANYTTATGGRNIPLPLGDLMNPVYATLNQLTNSHNFPTLENEKINFLPKNYYDVRVRTSMPLINTDIAYNKRIKEQQVHLQEFEIQTYERELVKNIKAAYYNYLNAKQAVKIYESALQLAEESKRVNERLLENGTGLHAYVLRSNSEVQQVHAQITQAKQQEKNARLYFNSLLNRESDAQINIEYNPDEDIAQVTTLLLENADISDREELKSLQEAMNINETIIQMNKKFSVPKINGFVDLGSQAERLRINKESQYVMVGVQLELPLYNGKRNLHKIKQSQLDLDDAAINKTNVINQLEMSSHIAKNNLFATWETYQSSLKQLEAASAYQRLIERGYRAGTNTYIETIDARNQLTTAHLSTIVNKYNVLLAAANLERETAAYPLKK